MKIIKKINSLKNIKKHPKKKKNKIFFIFLKNVKN